VYVDDVIDNLIISVFLDLVYLFIYLIIEAKQSNAISINHSERVIIVSAAKADEG